MTKKEITKSIDLMNKIALDFTNNNFTIDNKLEDTLKTLINNHSLLLSYFKVLYGWVNGIEDMDLLNNLDDNSCPKYYHIKFAVSDEIVFKVLFALMSYFNFKQCDILTTKKINSFKDFAEFKEYIKHQTYCLIHNKDTKTLNALFTFLNNNDYFTNHFDRLLTFNLSNSNFEYNDFSMLSENNLNAEFNVSFDVDYLTYFNNAVDSFLDVLIENEIFNESEIDEIKAFHSKEYNEDESDRFDGFKCEEYINQDNYVVLESFNDELIDYLKSQKD